MPAYHLVLHTYGSWLPDQPTGYHSRKVGRRASNDGLANYYRSRMKRQSIQWTQAQQQLILNICRQPLGDNDYKVHAVAVVSNHLHAIISWGTKDELPEIKARFKHRLTHALNQQAHQCTGQWFCRGAGTTKIDGMDHLLELVKHYIPDHGENVWIEEKIRLRYRESPDPT